MTSIKHLDAVHDNYNAISEIADRIADLANAFHKTGNETVSETLYGYAREMNYWAKLVKDTFAEDLSEQVRFSEQATVNMLSAAMAGISICKTNDPAFPPSTHPNKPARTPPQSRRAASNDYQHYWRGHGDCALFLEVKT